MPAGAALNASIAKTAGGEARTAFEAAALAAGKKVADIAFVLDVKKTGLENTRDLGGATISEPACVLLVESLALIGIKAKIEKIDAHINELLRKVSTKQELRTIMCEWSFNWPDGQKKLVRTDTGEVIAEDQIREHEQQRHFDDLKKEQEEAEAEKIAAGDPIPKSVVINGHLA